jgi:hypothetical protein
MEFRSFTEARKFASSLNLKGVSEWEVYCKSGNKPDNIPSHPNGTYKNKGWQNWGNWLGTGRIADQDKVYRSFAEARKFAISLGLKTGDEWLEYCKSCNKPKDIPQKPARTYKNDWKGMGDWIGTGRISNSNKQYRPYKEARAFVRSLGLKNRDDWNKYCKSGDKPDDISATPWNTYKEWKRK